MAPALSDAVMLDGFGIAAVIVARCAGDLADSEVEDEAHDGQDSNEFIPPTHNGRPFEHVNAKFKLTMWTSDQMSVGRHC